MRFVSWLSAAWDPHWGWGLLPQLQRRLCLCGTSSKIRPLKKEMTNVKKFVCGGEFGHLRSAEFSKCVHTEEHI